MSLADELLADLEEPEDEDSELQSLMPPVNDACEEKEEGKPKFNYLKIKFKIYRSLVISFLISCCFAEVKAVNIHDIASLSSSHRLRNAMSKIAEIQSNGTTASDRINGPVEADPEYVLIVEANNLAVEIDNEICKLGLLLPALGTYPY